MTDMSFVFFILKIMFWTSWKMQVKQSNIWIWIWNLQDNYVYMQDNYVYMHI